MSKPNKHKEPVAPQPESISRRVFTGLALGGVGICYAAAVGYPVYRYLMSPVEKAAEVAAVTEVVVKDAQKLPVGSGVMFKFGAEPCLLIRQAEDKWTAMSAKCTHLGCTVQHEPEQNRIVCACHGGVYDPETGGNISGPPPRPLSQLVVKEVTEEGVRVARN